MHRHALLVIMFLLETAAAAASGPHLQVLDSGDEEGRVLIEYRINRSERHLMKRVEVETFETVGGVTRQRPGEKIHVVLATTAFESDPFAFPLQHRVVEVMVDHRGRPAEEVQQRQADLDPIRARGLRNGTSARHVMKGPTGDTIDGPRVWAEMERMGTLGGAAWVLLPTEPVGIGAQWGVADQFIDDELAGRVVHTYTLRGVDGDRINLDYEAKWTISPQKLVERSTLGTPGPEGGFLKAYEATESGHIEINFTSPVPIRVEATREHTITVADRSSERTVRIQSQWTVHDIQSSVDAARNTNKMLVERIRGVDNGGSIDDAVAEARRVANDPDVTVSTRQATLLYAATVLERAGRRNEGAALREEGRALGPFCPQVDILDAELPVG